MSKKNNILDEMYNSEKTKEVAEVTETKKPNSPKIETKKNNPKPKIIKESPAKVSKDANSKKTQIQVSKLSANVLGILKRDLNFKNFDELLKHLINNFDFGDNTELKAYVSSKINNG